MERYVGQGTGLRRKVPLLAFLVLFCVFDVTTWLFIVERRMRPEDFLGKVAKVLEEQLAMKVDVQVIPPNGRHAWPYFQELFLRRSQASQQMAGWRSFPKDSASYAWVVWQQKTSALHVVFPLDAIFADTTRPDTAMIDTALARSLGDPVFPGITVPFGYTTLLDSCTRQALPVFQELAAAGMISQAVDYRKEISDAVSSSRYWWRIARIVLTLMMLVGIKLTWTYHRKETAMVYFYLLKKREAYVEAGFDPPKPDVLKLFFSWRYADFTNAYTSQLANFREQQLRLEKERREKEILEKEMQRQETEFVTDVNMLEGQWREIGGIPQQWLVRFEGLKNQSIALEQRRLELQALRLDYQAEKERWQKEQTEQRLLAREEQLRVALDAINLGSLHPSIAKKIRTMLDACDEERRIHKRIHDLEAMLHLASRPIPEAPKPGAQGIAAIAEPTNGSFCEQRAIVLLRLSEFLPPDIDVPHAQAIIFALMPPGSRERFFGKRYKRSHSVKHSVAGKINHDFSAAAYKKALEWLVLNGVVIIPTTKTHNTVYSLNPHEDDATELGKPVVKQILFVAHELTPVG